jgi:hydroxymethylpyrimidine pyrophosphatase-like HAD family hydrolase
MTSNNGNDHCKKVIAIVSDYDGTLAPTGAIRSTDGKNRIPESLEILLLKISRQIPVCILSSKDYRFLHDKVPFANIISCILGIETVVLNRDCGPSSSLSADDIISHHLLVENDELLGTNDRTLNRLAEDIALQFPEIEVERKFTLDGLLAGITFDWRSQKEDWSKYSALVSAYVREVLSREPYCLSSNLNLQTYSSHPFVDVYAVECDKGMGFDCIVEELAYHSAKGSILYLGDSENDNPAFNKAGISVGIISDERLDSDHLSCDYLVNYNELANFLELLMENDFVFSDRIARAAKTILRQVEDRGKKSIGEHEKEE